MVVVGFVARFDFVLGGARMPPSALDCVGDFSLVEVNSKFFDLSEDIFGCKVVLGANGLTSTCPLPPEEEGLPLVKLEAVKVEGLRLEPAAVVIVVRPRVDLVELSPLSKLE